MTCFSSLLGRILEAVTTLPPRHLEAWSATVPRTGRAGMATRRLKNRMTGRFIICNNDPSHDPFAHLGDDGLDARRAINVNTGIHAAF